MMQKSEAENLDKRFSDSSDVMIRKIAFMS